MTEHDDVVGLAGAVLDVAAPRRFGRMQRNLFDRRGFSLAWDHSSNGMSCMMRAVSLLATAGLVGLCALAAPSAAQARPWNPWNPWPWPSQSPATPGPLYTHPGVYAPDALVDAYLRAGAGAPYGAMPAYPVASAVDDRTIIVVGPGRGARWHHRHRRHYR